MQQFNLTVLNSTFPLVVSEFSLRLAGPFEISFPILDQEGLHVWSLILLATLVLLGCCRILSWLGEQTRLEKLRRRSPIYRWVIVSDLALSNRALLQGEVRYK